MPARGAIAKANVMNKIAETFKEDYLGEEGGKLYLRAKDSDGWVKLALSLTCCRDTIAVDEPSAFAPKLDNTFYENLLKECGIPYKKEKF